MRTQERSPVLTALTRTGYPFRASALGFAFIDKSDDTISKCRNTTAVLSVSSYGVTTFGNAVADADEKDAAVCNGDADAEDEEAADCSAVVSLSSEVIRRPGMVIWMNTIATCSLSCIINERPSQLITIHRN
jgi:hypothetical protein